MGIRVIVLLAGLPFVVVGCSDGSGKQSAGATSPNNAEHTVAILRVQPYPSDGRAIALGVAAGCTTREIVTAHVDENGTTIRILARAKNDYIPPGHPSFACMPGVTVHLRSPLGQRVVIDASSGKVIKQET